MKITIVGGGNIGTLIAGQFSNKGHQVTIYTRDITKWSNNIEIIDKDQETTINAHVYKITENIKVAVENAKLIIITLPSFAIKKFIDEITDYIKPETYIGFYPGLGGVEFASKKLLEKGTIIFGTQRVCSISRLKKYGHTVVTSGKRKEMFISSIPNNSGEEVRTMFENFFEIKTNLLPNYLSVTLTPSNPILHTVRLYTIFKEYKKGKIYNNLPLFYEEWDLESSKLLINCDNELHNILDKMPKLNTTGIKKILDYYESNDAISLMNKINSIEAFKGITTPSVKMKGGYIPNLESRYFTEDFPYGIVIIKAFALITNCDTPYIDNIIRWYQTITNKKYIDRYGNLDSDTKDLLIPQNYGINSIEQIYEFYN